MTDYVIVTDTNIVLPMSINHELIYTKWYNRLTGAGVLDNKQIFTDWVLVKCTQLHILSSLLSQNFMQRSEIHNWIEQHEKIPLHYCIASKMYPIPYSLFYSYHKSCTLQQSLKIQVLMVQLLFMHEFYMDI